MPEGEEGIPITPLDVKIGLSLVQERRLDLRDLPDGTPFMFIGTGISVLADRSNEGNIWQTFPWQEASGQPRPLPTGIKPGHIYTLSGGGTYERIGIGADGKEWVWQNIDQKDKVIGETEPSLPVWEEKHYFDHKKMNGRMNTDGWTPAAADDGEGSYSPPEGLNLKVVEVEAHNLPEMRIRNVVVYDPERAEVLILKGAQRTKVVTDILQKQGWEFIDTNIARTIYIRTIPHTKKE